MAADPALDKLKQRANETNSDAVLIFKDGKEILNYSSGRHDEPIETMSATKSIVSLAIGFLIDDGFLESVDTPVWKFYPEWKQGRKELITVRHLLNHTSGLQSNPTTQEIYYNPGQDFVKLALAAELTDDPGTKFFYNNKATNLLAGIVQTASHLPMDEYLDQRLFIPLGITRSEWHWDHDGAGNPHGMAGLQMTAQGLAKIGQLVLHKGTWNGQRLISENWIDISLAAGSSLEEGCGLLWWRRSNFDENKFFYDKNLLNTYRKAGISENYIVRLEAILGELLPQTEIRTKLEDVLGGAAAFADFYQQVKAKSVPEINIKIGPIRFFSAEGSLGQYLVIFPEKGMVGVRQIHEQSSREAEQAQQAHEENSWDRDPMFEDFGQLLLQL